MATEQIITQPQDMPKLYSIVYQEQDENEADWLHVVATSMDEEKAEVLAKQHILDHYHFESLEEEQEQYDRIRLEHCWYEELTMVDSYSIELSKQQGKSHDN